MIKLNIPLFLIALSIGTNLLNSNANRAFARGSVLTYSKSQYDDQTSMIRVDSIRYTYSGGRQGDLITAGGIPFDSGISYNYFPPQSGPIPVNGIVTVKHYNPAGQVDTETNYWSSRQIRIYNAAGKMTQCDFQRKGAGNTWVYGDREFYYYDKTGKDSVNLLMSWNAAAASFGNSRVITWSYNAKGDLSRYLFETWDFSASAWKGSMRVTYLYNASGQPSSDTTSFWSAATAAWDVAQIRRNTYSGSFMTAQVIDKFIGGTLTGSDSSHFSSSITPVTLVNEIYRKPNATSPYTAYQRFTDVTNAAGNVESKVYEKWSGSAWTNFEKTFFFYNSDEQLIRQVSTRWKGSSWDYDPLNCYDKLYTYGPPTKVGNNGESEERIDFAISPVPANSNLRLNVKVSHQQAFQAVITDLNGQQLRSWRIMANSNNHFENVRINDLIPGVYFLSIECEEGRVTHNFVVR